MADFTSKKLNVNDINNGKTFSNGDGLTPNDINNIVEGVQFLTENIEPNYVVTLYTEPYTTNNMYLNKYFRNDIYDLRYINYNSWLMIVNNTFTQPSNKISKSIQTIFNGNEYFTRTLTFDSDGNYVSTTLSAKKTYLTNNDLSSTVQPKTLKFTNMKSTTWIKDGLSSDFPYKCSITLDGVTSNDVATIIYRSKEAISGNYSPTCETGTNKVEIRSKVDTQITIPTILVEVFK